MTEVQERSHNQGNSFGKGVRRQVSVISRIIKGESKLHELTVPFNCQCPGCRKPILPMACEPIFTVSGGEFFHGGACLGGVL